MLYPQKWQRAARVSRSLNDPVSTWVPFGLSDVGPDGLGASFATNHRTYGVMQERIGTPTTWTRRGQTSISAAGICLRGMRTMAARRTQTRAKAKGNILTSRCRRYS